MESTASAPAASGPTSAPSTPSSSATIESVPRGAPANTNATPAAPEQEAPAPRMFKVKLDDGEREVPEDELIKNYQLRTVSYKKFEEAAQLRKQAEAERGQVQQLIQTLKSNPNALFELAQRLGHDPRRLAESQLAEALRLEAMDPRERALYEKEQQIQAQMADAEQRQQAAYEAEVSRLAEHKQAEYVQSFGAALRAAGVQEHPRLLARMADIALAADAPLSPDQLAAIALEESRTEVKTYLTSLSDEDLLREIGEERMRRVRQKDLERVRTAPAAPQQAQPRPVQPRPVEKKNIWDWLEEAKRR